MIGSKVSVSAPNARSDPPWKGFQISVVFLKCKIRMSGVCTDSGSSVIKEQMFLGYMVSPSHLCRCHCAYIMLFNASIFNHEGPVVWKCAQVTPALKGKGSKSEEKKMKCNYRPILAHYQDN